VNPHVAPDPVVSPRLDPYPGLGRSLPHEVMSQVFIQNREVAAQAGECCYEAKSAWTTSSMWLFLVNVLFILALYLAILLDAVSCFMI